MTAAAPSRGREGPTSLPLEARGVRLEAGGRTLLNGVDLQLDQGALTMLLGPNGAGKSLLLKILHGLIAPTRGQVLAGGAPLDPARRRRQALVFQKPVLLRRSVGANVDFVLRARRLPRGDRDDLLDLVGLSELADQPARSLSGGEQQRLALARALACRPELLFLDEPTANLDPVSVLRIEQIVQATKAAGTRVVFVSHDVSQARRLADEVVFLHRGRVAEHRPANAFFEAPETEVARKYLAGDLVV